MSVKAEDVLSALGTRKNVLLSGPPGTGKTLLLSQIVAQIRNTVTGSGRPALRTSSASDPLTTTAGQGLTSSLPVPVQVDWITFHQGYSYEDFILGKRPVPAENGVKLEPHLGMLMSLAFEVADPSGPKGQLLIIDEISRANASQVFGEFITLLDPAYRTTVEEHPNPNAIPIKFPGISYVDGKSEPIVSQRRSSPVVLPSDWTFPEHVYVLAAMNSVDKAALPLDSALMRRFHKIQMQPDLGVLISAFKLNAGDFWVKAESMRQTGADLTTLTAEETVVLILERLNAAIAADLGEDFELGQGLVWPVVEAEQGLRWRALIDVWEHGIKPQLLERYAGRQDALKDLLHVKSFSTPTSFFSERTIFGGQPLDGAPVNLGDLSSAPEAQAQATLRSLIA